MRKLLPFIHLCFLLTGFLLTGFLSPAWAESTLKIPDAFNLLAVNGEKYSSGLFSNGSKIILPVGTNQIVLEYDELFEIDSDDHEIVGSDPFRIVLTLENGDFKMEYQKPKSVEEATLFSKSPQVSIINDATQRPVEVTLEQLATVSGGFADFFISKPVVSGNVEQKNQVIAPAYAQCQPQAMTDSSQQLTSAPVTFEMLQCWWRNAGENEQVKFKDWLDLK